MSISYNNITYIQNGQAINASNLNAPSVDLADRTVEIKRSSDQQIFSKAHTTDAEVLLISSSPENSSIVVKTELKEDGSADSNLVKYYLPEFNNLKFSIYAKCVHGGRYIIDGADVGSLFSDSINGSNSVYSTGLTVPGDGVYAKVPLRHTGDAESLLNYPDLVYPKSKTQSLGGGYLSSAPTAELVKLPELVIMDLLSTTAGENVASFTTRLQTQFSDIDSITVSAEGSLQILDVNGQPLTLSITGTQEGAECSVTHLLERQDGEPGFIAKFSRASSPIYLEHDSRISVISLGVSLLRGSNVLDSSASPISGGNYTGYFILPELLDPNYAYVPLVRLTENSLLVGNKSISLNTRQLPNGESINIHGDPVYGVPPEFSSEEIEEYTLNILTNNRVGKEYKGKHTIRVGTSIVDNSVSPFTWLKASVSDTQSPELKFLRQNLQEGDKLRFLEVRAHVVEQCVSGTGNTDTMSISARISMPNGGLLFLTADGATVNTPVNSLDLGNTLELLPDSQSTYTWTSQNASANSSYDLTFYSYVSEDTNQQNMISGKVYVEFDLLVF